MHFLVTEDQSVLTDVARSGFPMPLSSMYTCHLTHLHSEWPNLYGALTVLSAIGLKKIISAFLAF